MTFKQYVFVYTYFNDTKTRGKVFFFFNLPQEIKNASNKKYFETKLQIIKTSKLHSRFNKTS